MSTSTGPYSLTLQTLLLIPNPTLGGPDFANVQLQNATPFTLSVVAGGEQYTIPSFTAQTVPLIPDGNPITVLPTTGPAGGNLGLTTVWLLPGEEPPVVDGQLTAAATYSEGLGSLLVPTEEIVSGTPFGVAVPPTVRTLIFLFLSNGLITGVTIQGQTTGLCYYGNTLGGGGQVPYLQPANSSFLGGMIFVPVSALADPNVTVTCTVEPGTTQLTVEIWGDTLFIDETQYYNGKTQVVYTNVNGEFTINYGAIEVAWTGPARLLWASLSSNAAGSQLYNATTEEVLLTVIGPSSGYANETITFPENTLISNFDQLKVQGGSTGPYCSVGFAYP